MARSIADIPRSLRHPTSKSGFITWMAHLPLDSQAKRRLIKIWCDHSGIKFTQLDYIEAGSMEL